VAVAHYRLLTPSLAKDRQDESTQLATRDIRRELDRQFKQLLTSDKIQTLLDLRDKLVTRNIQIRKEENKTLQLRGSIDRSHTQSYFQIDEADLKEERGSFYEVLKAYKLSYEEMPQL